MIAYVAGDKAFFLFGFAKSQRDNIGGTDERKLAQTGALLLALDAARLELAEENGELTEVDYAEEA